MELFKDSQVLVVTMPVCLGLIAVEIVVSHLLGRPYYTLSGTLANVGLAAVNVVLDVSLRGFWFVALACVFRARLFDLPGGPWYWVGLLVCQDFLFYWLHRVDHGCRLFWAVHSTHHSAGEFNLTVGFRPSVLQPVYRFAWFLPLARSASGRRTCFSCTRPPSFMVFSSTPSLSEDLDGSNGSFVLHRCTGCITGSTWSTGTKTLAWS